MGYNKDRGRRTVGGFSIKSGTMLFSCGTVLWNADTALYRGGANTLTLASGDQMVFTGAATDITMTNGTALWGTDCKLYKRAAGTLITDQAFAASQGLVTKINTAAVAVAVPDAIGHIHLQQVGGTARIVCSLFAGSAFYVNLTTWS